MRKDIKKLASLIKLCAKDISRPGNYYKDNYVSIMLGFHATDAEPGELYVTDDSGYRSITLGDTRGNVSLDTGKRNNRLKHHGYMLLYSDQATYDTGKEKFQYPNYPSVAEIANRLEQIANGISLIPEGKNNCDYDEFWYDNRKPETLQYLADLVNKFAKAAAEDTRSAQEIFNSWR